MSNEEDSGNDRTPVRGGPPEYLAPREVRQLERILGSETESVHLALAGRYRAEGADLHIIVSKVATDVDRLKPPVSLAKKLAIGVASSSVAIVLFVAYLVSDRTRTDTSVEYRLRACEAALARIESILDRIDPRRPDYPMATVPSATKGPIP